MLKYASVVRNLAEVLSSCKSSGIFAIVKVINLVVFQWVYALLMHEIVTTPNGPA